MSGLRAQLFAATFKGTRGINLMATEKTQPFDELSEEMQKACVDVGVLATAMGVRLPSIGQAGFDYVCEQFLKSYVLPNSAKYALRHVAAELWNSDWEFTITKKGNRLVTKYDRLQGGNGELKVE